MIWYLSEPWKKRGSKLIDTCLFFHLDNLDLTASTTGFHVPILLGFMPIDKPRYLNGLLCNTFYASSSHVWDVLAPTNKLLLKLTFKLDINSNSNKFALIILILDHLFSQMMSVSSGYWRWVNQSSPLSNLNQLNFPKSIALLVNILKPYAIIRNKNNNKGYPCLSPRLILNSSMGLPFTNTDTNDDLRHSEIHLLHFSWNPIFVITKSKKFQSTESYAFSKSTLNKMTCFILFLVLSTISLAIRIPPTICLPEINVDCVFNITVPITLFFSVYSPTLLISLCKCNLSMI